MSTIYEQIGGHAALVAVVDDFYVRVLGDETLAPFFIGVAMPRLKGHQVEFFASALGGPMEYRGRSMKDVHRGLGVEQAHFDGVAAHLSGALVSAGVPAETVSTIIDTIAPLAADIVSPTAAAS
ncbi:group I truncated hemoglobin [Actinoalloteichus hymeniacidonis]|uniref:Group 1 truncated hemoglobin n=1 Tax=Actinoalloteichus hymeniacidonis TaxID=340345 RepID=A0AAC9HQ31_9PSEU|nr:group 1 truncated hemoglobin [Actinoalloteichus hymeniacidonis]AOS63487.1 hemoglobin-like protein [Actinoalloteichus hymeniacidonis]MBB5908469.1 hemoglobin [Actinoalloteichus hymeniacidonis]